MMPLKDRNFQIGGVSFQTSSPELLIYSEAELLRLRECPYLIEEEIQKILDYLDPELKYENMLNTVECYWTVKESTGGGLSNVKYVSIDLSKLKNETNLYSLFLEDTITWMHNFYFQWRLKFSTLCELEIIDKSTPTNINSIRKKDIGKYYYFNARVKRISNLNVAVTTSYFQCPKCKNEFCRDRLWYEKLKEEKCSCGVKSPLVEKETNRRYETWQTISVQDTADQGVEENSGFILEVRVLNSTDLFKVLPGEEVKIKGILKSQITEKAKSKLYLDVLSISPLVIKKTTIFTAKKIKKLEKLGLDPLLSEKIKEGVFPHLTGLDQIKDAVILQYLGGSGTTSRTSIHLLISGDAGVGKSQILKSVQKCFGGYYSTGLGSSIAGLTATVYKDVDSQWNLDGGAVVLASGSTLLLDEADKLPLSVSNALLEPMEQQTVSVAKAGIAVSLPAKTKLLAVSNPKLGQKFDTTSTIPLRDQLGFAPPFLSRFDLIFLITEESQKKEQKRMAEVVLEGHHKRQIDPDLVEYLRYAKSLEPVIPQQIKKDIVMYYNELKRKYEDQLPLGPRYIEGLARLSEAKCKLRLGSQVNKEDLSYVKELVESSIYSQGIRSSQINTIPVPELVNLYVDKSVNFLAHIIETLKGGSLEMNELFLKVIEMYPKRSYSEFCKAIKKLENEGVIYKPDGMKYQLIAP